MSKNKWKRPKLIVLIRTKPEEAVLQACKTSAPIGPGATNVACQEFEAPSCTNPCYDSGS